MTRPGAGDPSPTPTPTDPASESPSGTGSGGPPPDAGASGSPGQAASTTAEPVPGMGSPPPTSGYQPPAESSDGPARSGAPAPDPDTTAAVQTALGAEYAAVWTYTLITAFLSSSLQATAQQDLDTHRARRDSTIRLLTDYGVPPDPAEPAYRTPTPVTDSTSAVRLAVSAESDASAGWHSVLQRCDDPGLRRIALDGLTDSAVRGARWSDRLGTRPVVPQFPGGSTST